MSVRTAAEACFGKDPVSYGGIPAEPASQGVPPQKKPKSVDQRPEAPFSSQGVLPLSGKQIRALPGRTKQPPDPAKIKEAALRLLVQVRQGESEERAERLRESPPEPIQEVADDQQAQNPVADLVCRAMSDVMNRPSNPQDGGVWYPDEFQAGLAKSGTKMPFDYLTGHVDEEFFLKGRDEETDEVLFTLKPGKRASEGLLRFLRGPTIATCGMITTACAYKALLDTYGAEKFDHMFTDDAPMIIEAVASEDFFEETDTATHCLMGSYGNRPLKIGDLCRFENVPWYLNKHPGGSGDGLNCVYMGIDGKGNQVFGGLGLQKPSTEGEIYEWLIQDYNRPRDAVDHMLIREKGEAVQFPNTIFLEVFGTIDPKDPQDLERQGFVSFVPEVAFRLRPN